MLLYPFLFSSLLFQQFSSIPILIILSTISTILFYTHSYSPHYYFKNSLSYPLLFSLLFQQFSLCAFFFIATITIIPPLSICFASPTPLPTHHHMLLELNLEEKKNGNPSFNQLKYFFIDCFVQHKQANTTIAHEASLKNSYGVDNNSNNQQ